MYLKNKLRIVLLIKLKTLSIDKNNIQGLVEDWVEFQFFPFYIILH